MQDYTEIPAHCNTPRTGWIVNRATRRFLKCPCGRWKCPGCAQHKARIIARRFALMVRGRAARMVTVTLKDEISERDAKTQMRSLRRWMSRHGLIEKAGWVAEFGARGHRLHFHMLVATSKGFWPYAELQAASRRCGLGNLDVTQEVKHDESARYLAKYLSKQTGAKISRTIARRRRFYCPEAPPAKTGEWEWAPLSPAAQTPVDMVFILPDHSWMYLRPEERRNEFSG